MPHCTDTYIWKAFRRSHSLNPNFRQSPRSYAWLKYFRALLPEASWRAWIPLLGACSFFHCMASSEGGLEGIESLSMEAVPYKTFLSDLSQSSPDLQSLQSLSLGLESDIDRSEAISTLSLLLSTLRVPGPCDLIFEPSPLGRGAQFDVTKQ